MKLAALWSWDSPPPDDAPVDRILVTDDAALLCRGAVVDILSFESGSLVCSFTGHQNQIIAICLLQGSSNTIASLSIDGSILVWDASLNTAHSIQPRHEVCMKANAASSGCLAAVAPAVIAFVSGAHNGAGWNSGIDLPDDLGCIFCMHWCASRDRLALAGQTGLVILSLEAPLTSGTGLPPWMLISLDSPASNVHGIFWIDKQRLGVMAQAGNNIGVFSVWGDRQPRHGTAPRSSLLRVFPERTVFLSDGDRGSVGPRLLTMLREDRSDDTVLNVSLWDVRSLLDAAASPAAKGDRHQATVAGFHCTIALPLFSRADLRTADELLGAKPVQPESEPDASSGIHDWQESFLDVAGVVPNHNQAMAEHLFGSGQKVSSVAPAAFMARSKKNKVLDCIFVLNPPGAQTSLMALRLQAPEKLKGQALQIKQAYAPLAPIKGSVSTPELNHSASAPVGLGASPSSAVKLKSNFRSDAGGEPQSSLTRGPALAALERKVADMQSSPGGKEDMAITMGMSAASTDAPELTMTRQEVSAETLDSTQFSASNRSAMDTTAVSWWSQRYDGQSWATWSTFSRCWNRENKMQLPAAPYKGHWLEDDLLIQSPYNPVFNRFPNLDQSGSKKSKKKAKHVQRQVPKNDQTMQSSPQKGSKGPKRPSAGEGMGSLEKMTAGEGEGTSPFRWLEKMDRKIQDFQQQTANIKAQRVLLPIYKKHVSKFETASQEPVAAKSSMYDLQDSYQTFEAQMRESQVLATKLAKRKTLTLDLRLLHHTFALEADVPPVPLFAHLAPPGAGPQCNRTVVVPPPPKPVVATPVTTPPRTPPPEQIIARIMLMPKTTPRTPPPPTPPPTPKPPTPPAPPTPQPEVDDEALRRDAARRIQSVKRGNKDREKVNTMKEEIAAENLRKGKIARRKAKEYLIANAKSGMLPVLIDTVKESYREGAQGLKQRKQDKRRSTWSMMSGKLALLQLGRSGLQAWGTGTRRCSAPDMFASGMQTAIGLSGASSSDASRRFSMPN